MWHSVSANRFHGWVHEFICTVCISPAMAPIQRLCHHRPKEVNKPKELSSEKRGPGMPFIF